jgi:hypothetical protein
MKIKPIEPKLSCLLEFYLRIIEDVGFIYLGETFDGVVLKSVEIALYLTVFFNLNFKSLHLVLNKIL